MKVGSLISVFILFFFFNALGQITSTSNLSNHGFYYELLNFKSNQPGEALVEEYIELPYDKVSFVRAGSEFEADYSITVSVYDKSKKKLITEKMWNEKISTKDFDETSSSKSFNISQKSFDLIAGEYFFQTSIKDKNSRKSYSDGKIFEVKYLSPKYSISDLLIVSKKIQQNGEDKVVPNVSGNVVLQSSTFPIFFEIYSDTSRQAVLNYSIRNSDKDIIIQDTASYELKKGTNQIYHTFTDTNLDIGTYNVTVKVKSPTEGNVLVASKDFNAFWYGFPTSVKNIDEAINEMVYIASASELSYIKNGKTLKERIKRYKEFWQKKNPLPSSGDNMVFDEYYGRVAYANEHFSTYVRGWKSDRGMVFITLGPPDNIDRHPMDMNAKPYEVWEYYDLNRSFVFVDETGFGDYRLVTPFTGDLFRYRY